MTKERTILVIRKSAVVFAILGLSISTVFSILGFLDRLAFWFNLLVQFRWQYLAVQLFSILALALLTRKTATAWLLLLMGLNVVPLLPYFLTNTSEPLESKLTMRIAQMNANSKNEEYFKVLNYIRTSNPDAFIVEELNPTLTVKINEALTDYPFTYARPQTTPYGIGVWSKFPIQDCKFVELVSGGRIAVFCSFRKGKQSITLVGVHLASPTTVRSWSEQIEEFEILSKEIELLPRPLVVAGDFNATPWTSNVQWFLNKSKLKDARVARGLQCTWPSDRPISRIPITNEYVRLSLPLVNRLLMLPIDHFLLSEDLTPRQITVGPDIGSDHYPVLLEL